MVKTMPEQPLTDDEMDRLRLALRVRALEQLVASLVPVLRAAAPESLAQWEEKLALWHARSRTVKLSEMTGNADMLAATEYEAAIARLVQMVREGL